MKQKRKKIIATFMMILILLNNSLNVFATEEVVVASEEPVASIEATNSENVQEEPAASVEEAQDQEAPAETVTTPENNDSAAETQNEAPVQDEPVLEEPKQENKEPAVTVGEEMANSENNSEEDVLVEEKASVEKTTEESDTSDEEELLITDEEEKDVIVEEDEDKEDDKEDLSETMPEQTFEEQIGNVHVKVTAEEGTFYANTRMEAKLVEKETIIDSLENVVENFVDTVVAVDITFYNEANEIVEPEKAVNVEITSDEINKMDDPVIAHLNNDGNTEIVDQKEEITGNDKVGFEADSFSIYAVFGTIETTCITADGQSYNITVTYNANSGIPKDAKLDVREIILGSEEYNNYNNQALDKVGANEVQESASSTGNTEGLYELKIVNPPIEEDLARFFDISIISDGNKIEPLTPVDVKIKYNEPIDLSNNKELKVVHFADNGIETITPNVNGSEISFKQNSFSVTGTIRTSVNNSRSYAILVQHEEDFYEVKYDGTLEKVMSSGNYSYTIAMAEAWTYNNNSIYVTTNNGSTYIRPNDANGFSTTETRITRASSGNGYTFSSDNKYLGVTTDTVTGQLKISGNNSSNNASIFYFASLSSSVTNYTVDHIDIGVEAKASVEVPLAYGTYYYSNGTVAETVAVGENKNATGVNNKIPINEQDLMSANINSYKKDSSGNRVIDNSFIITEYTSSTQAGEIDQVRIGGTFPVGEVTLRRNGSRGNIESYITSDNQIYYEVAVQKVVTLTLQKNGETLYQKDNAGNLVPLTVDVSVTLTSSFSYWDDKNECPGIQYCNGFHTDWKNHSLYPSGMDFRLGTTDEVDASISAIEIMKYLVDEDGNTIELPANTSKDFIFKIYNDSDGDVTKPVAWSGETTSNVDYSGYTEITDRKVNVSTSGIGIAYDYSVDSGLVYIEEDRNTIPQTITDKNGNELSYKGTYIKTEYAWRNDNGVMHSNINQTNTLTAIPDVVGDYYSTTYEGSLHNTFLEFYVYNIYERENQEGSLKIQKNVTGTSLADKEFNIKIELTPPTGVTLQGTYTAMVGTTEKTLTVSNNVIITTIKSGETIVINGLPVGTSYSVTESNLPSGYTQGRHSNVTGSIVANSEAEVVLNNIYSAEDVQATIEVTKVLNGRALNADEFEFTLKDAEGNVVESGVKNAANGKVIFSPITYHFADLDGNTEKEFEYTITEAAGNLGGVTYSREEIKAKVKVTDNGDGTLSAEVTYTPEAKTITNTYSAEDVQATIEVTKVLNGRALNADEFEFTLKDAEGNVVESGVKNAANGKVIFSPITYHFADLDGNTEKEFEYTITEAAGNLGGVTYSREEIKAKVKVTDNGDGTLSAEVTYTPEAKTITNTYSAEDVQATIEVTKVLNGRALNADEFEFTIKDAEGNVVESGVKNAADGKVTFSPIKYTFADLEGKTEKVYEYTITEDSGNIGGVTYSREEIKAIVKVKDNGDGTLSAEVTYTPEANTITNTYTAADVQAKIETTKVLTGRKLKAEEFSFTLKDAEGNVKEAGVKNAANGKVIFSPITYHFADLEGNTQKEFKYTITEDSGNLGGVTYSAEEIKVTVTVKDKGDGTLTANVTYPTENKITNTYSAKDVQAKIETTKVLTGRKLKAEEFSLTLKDAEGNVVESGVKNAANGKVTFSPITYHFADLDGNTQKEFEYTITEAAGNLGGVTYSEEEIKAKVTDNGYGTLSAEVTYTPEENTITNTYTATGTAEIMLNKSLEGKEIDAEEFEFNLIETTEKELAKKDSSEEAYTDTVRNNKQGEVKFKIINYSLEDVGTHTYKITEKDLGEDGYVYDDKKIEATVEVTDNGDGTLNSKISYSDESKTFNNKYETVNINVNKVWDDNDNQDGLRPEQINVTLFADGEEKETVALSEENEWSYSWNGLVKHSNKENITYTIEETERIKGYEVSSETISDELGNLSVTITNKHIPGTTSINVSKTWDDLDNKFGLRPETITVRLMANGKEIKVAKINEKDNNWKYTFNNLDEYSNGEKIKYSISEDEIPYYTATITKNNERDYTITNKIIPMGGQDNNENITVVTQVVPLYSSNPATRSRDNIILYVSLIAVSILAIVIATIREKNRDKKIRILNKFRIKFK